MRPVPREGTRTEGPDLTELQVAIAEVGVVVAVEVDIVNKLGRQRLTSPQQLLLRVYDQSACPGTLGVSRAR